MVPRLFGKLLDFLGFEIRQVRRLSAFWFGDVWAGVGIGIWPYVDGGAVQVPHNITIQYYSKDAIGWRPSQVGWKLVVYITKLY